MSDITPAGWQPDPTGRHEHRYWDGTTWTDNVSDAGTAATDPFTEAAAPETAGASDAPTWADPTTTTPVAPADTTAAWSTTPGAPVPPLPQPVVAGSDGNGGSKRGLLIGGGILAAIAVAVIAVLALGGSTDTGDTTTTVETTTTEETTTTDGGITDFDTSVPDNFEDILADTYENSLGLPRDKAECLAGKLADAIESGALSQDEAASAVFEYLEACDIALDEIGAN